VTALAPLEQRVHPAPVRPRAIGGGRSVRDGAIRVVCGSLLWLSLLLVSSWWVTGRGIQDLGGWETGLTSLGRLTGLAASVLLLAQVLLMARVPAVESAFGQDRLTRIHRVVGFTSFTLVVAHVVLITWGYAAGSLLRTPATMWDLTLHDPGMLLAAAGTLCLVMVVATSIRAARRRLRYESWHLMHLYAYLGVGFALPHQLWTGQELVSSTARTVFWWTAWAATAAAVLWWRVGVPLTRNLRHQLRVAAVVPEGDGVASVYLTGRRLDRLAVEAGQFMTFRFLGRAGWTRANPYSLSAAPDGRSLRITVGAVGDGSASVPALVPRSLQGLTELVVTRNYGIALLFITPLALVLGQLADPRPTGPLLLDRLVETLLGVAIGTIAAVLTRQRTPSVETS
jgi:predicted ferric reductase